MSAEWVDVRELDPERRAAVRRQLAEFVQAHPKASLDHEPEWVETFGAQPVRGTRTLVYLARGQEVLGYAPFLVHPSELHVELGHFSVFRYAIRRFSITAEPLLASDTAPTPSVVLALLRKLAEGFGPRDVAFCLGCRLDSSFFLALSSRECTHAFQVVPHGPAYARRTVDLPDDFETYMGQLGAKTRQDLRRQERRLREKADGSLSCVAYRRPEHVEEFLTHAEAVSRRTYQARLLGLAVRNSASFRATLALAAQRQWLRCYMLFCGGQPIAFMLGYQHRGVYYSASIGYDPDWSEWSPGNVLHLHVVRDLIADRQAVAVFDFLYGDNPNKARLSTASRSERNFYIVPRTLGWTALLTAIRACNRAIEVTGYVAGRAGLKQRLKRVFHRRASGVR